MSWPSLQLHTLRVMLVDVSVAPDGGGIATKISASIAIAAVF